MSKGCRQYDDRYGILGFLKRRILMAIRRFREMAKMRQAGQIAVRA